MSAFLAAFWAELLKARRSLVSLFTAAGILLLPLVGGLFMIILKDPERARAMGLIGAKAQLTAGVADWLTFVGLLLQGTAIAGMFLFAIITAWVFGREFADHTAKELLALPTPRTTIIVAKFSLTALWFVGLALLVFGVGLAIGAAVDIPGWSPDLPLLVLQSILVITLLSFMLMPFVALFASMGRGYLPPVGWAFLTFALAQIAAVLGRGDWVPWSVPVLFSRGGVIPALQADPLASQLGLHSYVGLVFIFFLGLGLTVLWWRNADQTS